MIELDHVFICTSEPERSVAALEGLGLDMSVRREHRGQGTRNACAVFENAYLELLWESDEADLRSQAVRPLGLWERMRWRETGACPFGIAVRGLNADRCPWRYAAPYLPDGIGIATPRERFGEPLVFASPNAGPHRESAGHTRLRRSITRLLVSGPGIPGMDRTAAGACQEAGVVLRDAPEWELEAWLGGHAAAECRRVPGFPLVLWR